jgi:Mrp family chromosome partitioning ATPase
VKIIYIVNPNVTFKNLLRTIYKELGLAVKRDDIVEMLNRLYQILMEEDQQGNTVLMIVDDAQNMPIETLRSLCMLSNLETSKDKLLQMVLLGQYEFEKTLDCDALRQLRQRIAIRSTILPFTEDESIAYITHRLRKASVFTNGALKTIVKEAQGIPYNLNILCDHALTKRPGYKTKPVDPKIAKEVITHFIPRAAPEHEPIERLSRAPEKVPSRPRFLPHTKKVLGLGLDKEIRLYQNLSVLIPDSTRKIIQFIGSREGEGTSTVVREFARVSASKFGKLVLLLDADQYHPTQHLFFNIQPECGWQEVLQDNGPIDKALYQSGETRLFVSPSSQNFVSDLHTLNSLLIDDFWKKLRERFDLILIDSPPATISADGLALSSKVDGIVLVVEAEKTRWPVAESVKDRINRSGGKILGIVLNKRRLYIPEWVYKRL